MERIQNRAQIAAVDVARINAGMHVLRKVFEETAPADVQWWFTFSEGEVTLCWIRGFGGQQDELRRSNFEELLEDWRRIDWRVGTLQPAQRRNRAS